MCIVKRLSMGFKNIWHQLSQSGAMEDQNMEELLAKAELDKAEKLQAHQGAQGCGVRV